MDAKDSERRSGLKIAISGASGFIGTQLTKLLKEKGHEVIKLVRKRESEAPDELCFDPDIKHIDPKGLEGTDVLINLSGKSLAEEKWSNSVKSALKDSRINVTKLLANSLSRLKKPPRLFLSASAIGYYGHRGDEMMKESDEAGTGFLSQLCREWELATWEAQAIGITVNHLRFGVVLAPHGGLLKEVLPIFKRSMGGIIGEGTQYLSWVSLNDATRAILFLIENPQPTGSFNIVSPNAVTNKEFTNALAVSLNKSARIRVPARLVKFMKGEMGEVLALESTRVEPKKLQSAGFRFEDSDISQTLRKLLS